MFFRYWGSGFRASRKGFLSVCLHCVFGLCKCGPPCFERPICKETGQMSSRAAVIEY